MKIILIQRRIRLPYIFQLHDYYLYREKNNGNLEKLH